MENPRTNRFRTLLISLRLYLLQLFSVVFHVLSKVHRYFYIPSDLMDLKSPWLILKEHRKKKKKLWLLSSGTLHRFWPLTVLHVPSSLSSTHSLRKNDQTFGLLSEVSVLLNKEYNLPQIISKNCLFLIIHFINLPWYLWSKHLGLIPTTWPLTLKCGVLSYSQCNSVSKFIYALLHIYWPVSEVPVFQDVTKILLQMNLLILIITYELKQTETHTTCLYSYYDGNSKS